MSTRDVRAQACWQAHIGEIWRAGSLAGGWEGVGRASCACTTNDPSREPSQAALTHVAPQLSLSCGASIRATSLVRPCDEACPVSQTRPCPGNESSARDTDFRVSSVFGENTYPEVVGYPPAATGDPATSVVCPRRPHHALLHASHEYQHSTSHATTTAYSLQ